VNTLLLITKLFYFFLPAGIANMAPVLVKNQFVWLARPVDSGRTLWGKPLFGDHKTWRGLIFATLFGGIFFLIQYAAAWQFPAAFSWLVFDITILPWWFGFLFSFGAIMGDLIKSFFKRRFRVSPGRSWFPFDQIDFLLGAAIIAILFFNFTPVIWLVIITLGPFMHIAFNYIGYWLKLKDSAW